MYKPSVTCCIICDNHHLKADGNAGLYIRITIARKSKFIALNKYIKPDCFDFKKKRVKESSKVANPKLLNRYLDEQLHKLEDLIIELERRNHALTFENIKMKFYGTDPVDFHGYAARIINEERNRIKASTQYGYQCTLNKLKRYQPQLSLYEIDKTWLENYRNHLIEELNNKQNTVHSDLRMIRKIIKRAYDEDAIQTYPFKHFKFEREEVEKQYLTIEEINKLHQFYDSKKLLNLNKVDKRNHLYFVGKKHQELLQQFLVAIYSGLRLSDIRRLRYKHIEDGMIVMKMQKGRRGKEKVVRIPIRERLLSVLNLEKSMKPEDKVYDGVVRLSSDTNTRLREIVSMVGIRKHITFHSARHSFAIASLILNIPIEVVGDLLGHRDLRVTQIYARIVDKKREMEMDKWDNFPST